MLAADVDGLQMLLGQHDAAVADARVPERAAAAAVANARLELRRGEARAVEEAANARVQAAADALVVDLHLARQVRGELGGGPARWSVPEALWNVLVPLRHNRAW